MINKSFKIQATVWMYTGEAAWHFVTITKEITEEINFYFGHAKRGWGSLPVKATIGATTWQTSIFFDKKTESFLLPLKSEIRKAEHIQASDKITVILEISG